MTQAAVVLGMLMASASPCMGATIVRGAGGHFLAHKAGMGMRPDLVAKTLAKVGDEWTEETMQFFSCNESAATASDAKACENKDFQKSCPTVVNAIVQASNGDRAVVVEYMGDVCDEPALAGAHHGQCQVLATTLSDKLTSDSYDNRERMDTDRFCQEFWTRLTAEERRRTGEERLARLERETKAAEAAAAPAKAKAEEKTEKPAEEEAERVLKEAETAVAAAKADVKTVKAANITAVNSTKASAGNNTEHRAKLCYGSVAVTYNTPPSSDWASIPTESGACFKSPGVEKIKICGFAKLEATTQMDCSKIEQTVDMTSNDTMADCKTITSSNPYFNAFKFTCPY